MSSRFVDFIPYTSYSSTITRFIPNIEHKATSIANMNPAPKRVKSSKSNYLLSVFGNSLSIKLQVTTQSIKQIKNPNRLAKENRNLNL